LLQEAIAFRLSWCQADEQPEFWPSLAAEWLGIVGSLVFSAQSFIYLGSLTPEDLDAVISLQFVGTVMFLVDSWLYLQTWAEGQEEEPEDAGAASADCSPSADEEAAGTAMGSNPQAAATAAPSVEGPAAQGTGCIETRASFPWWRCGIPCPPRLSCRMTLRHTWVNLRTVDVCTNMWNIVPSILYVAGATMGVVLRASYSIDLGDDDLNACCQNTLEQMSRIYVVADVMFLYDAVLVYVGWRKAFYDSGEAETVGEDGIGAGEGTPPSAVQRQPLPASPMIQNPLRAAVRFDDAPASDSGHKRV
jgi:hypothetical protein